MRPRPLEVLKAISPVHEGPDFAGLSFDARFRTQEGNQFCVTIFLPRELGRVLWVFTTLPLPSYGSMLRIGRQRGGELDVRD